MTNVRPGTGEGPDRGPTTGTPRRVKVVGALAVVLVLLVGVMLIFGGGNHGPERHLPPDDAGQAPPPHEDTPSDGADGHTPPARHSP